jgi:hypothetical protein
MPLRTSFHAARSVYSHISQGGSLGRYAHRLRRLAQTCFVHPTRRLALFVRTATRYGSLHCHVHQAVRLARALRTSRTSARSHFSHIRSDGSLGRHPHHAYRLAHPFRTIIPRDSPSGSRTSLHSARSLRLHICLLGSLPLLAHPSVRLAHELCTSPGSARSIATHIHLVGSLPINAHSVVAARSLVSHIPRKRLARTSRTSSRFGSLLVFARHHSRLAPQTRTSQNSARSYITHIAYSGSLMPLRTILPRGSLTAYAYIRRVHGSLILFAHRLHRLARCRRTNSPITARSPLSRIPGVGSLITHARRNHRLARIGRTSKCPARSEPPHISSGGSLNYSAHLTCARSCATHNRCTRLAHRARTS